MSEKPLNEMIDLEAYDVVTGESFRALQAELEAAREREKALREALHGIVQKYGNESNLRAWVPAKAVLDLLAAPPAKPPAEGDE